jgi:hypothetical protein
VNERETIDRGWYYVVEPEGGRHAPVEERIVADDGAVLTRRLHGFGGAVEVVDASGAGLTVATLLRAGGAVGRALERRDRVGEVVVVLGPAGTEPRVGSAMDGRLQVVLDGPATAAAPVHHAIDALASTLLADVVEPPRRAFAPSEAGLPARPVPRAMFFESLMNTDMPHNDRELSQGVLHLVAPLRGSGTEVVLVNAKMPIVGDERPVWGLEKLEAALAEGPVHLVAITLLEGYWDGVGRLIRTLRQLGCRAHVAVGGVMPTLAPEHVAAHLDEVTFVCRGAGEPFLPALCRVVGTSTVDDAFTEAQRHALLGMRGMIVVERAGPGLRLLAADCAHTVKVDDLDRVPLDLSHLEARHVEGGIEIATSRGCIHKCSFCSILGRESYQARSAGSIFDVLSSYEARFRELFGDHVPPNCYRVHVSDDDFACDRERARAFFERLPDTPFRLSSAQVSIADLCTKVNGKLTTEPDHALLDAMKPSCFADHGRPIPKEDFFEDHKSRTWSSFLQIGVETYDDAEIARLGKGYKRVHVRTIVAELARRGLHMDGYFILSNAETSADDLVNVFTEVARLKLRFPEHFHMRFPVVQHLVSYFTSASHRRHVRRGRRHVMTLRGFASTPGHPELDYPFVDHDEPEDPVVRHTVARTFVTDQGLYTGNLLVLSTLWRQLLDTLPAASADRPRLERLVRKLDDRPRRLVFEMLRQAWFQEDDEWPGARLDRERCLETAERVLGPHDGWLGLLKAWLKREREARVVLALDADASALDGTLDLLAASDEASKALHLLVPHGTVPGSLVVAAVDRARARLGPELRVILDVDGWDATPAVAAALAARGVEAQIVRRTDTATHSLAAVRALVDAGLPVRTILQLPAAAPDPGPAWAALAAAGVSEAQLEPLPEGWTDADATALAQALFRLAPHRGPVRLLDLEGARERSGQLGEVLVDRDGTIGRSDGLVPGQGLKPAWRLGALDDLTNLDRHHLALVDPDALKGVPRLVELRRRTARAEQVLARFVAWVRGRGLPAEGAAVGA